MKLSNSGRKNRVYGFSEAKIITLITLILILTSYIHAEDGYKLWLRYNKIGNSKLLGTYNSHIQSIWLTENNETFLVVRKEIELALQGLLGQNPVFSTEKPKNNGLIIGTAESVQSQSIENVIKKLHNPAQPDGYVIINRNTGQENCIYIIGSTKIGALYGTFHFIRLLQMHQQIDNLDILEFPKIKNRILNHWDNLDRTVERGYAGFSIWDWHRLPDYIDQRYIEYARANASIGINGTVLTNVNANSIVLTEQYIGKVAALAKTFRPYGIKVYLTARFSSPIEIGGLPTADPLDKKVQEWWKQKVSEIYSKIPDFGGFLVKANSEGQPGPQNYNRSHADGANMLAGALAPFGGIVMWRAFVYTHKDSEDRAKQANNEFEPLDGRFRDNVLIQTKNGPIDFQPREPFHPLFGSMPNTQLALELQITQEYLGQGTQLVYLAPLYKECLNSDTYAQGTGTTVAKIIDGTVSDQRHSAIAGVSNIGTDRNWTGHHFGQANWYSFGRLAWNHELTPEIIAKEWITLTFSPEKDVVDTILNIMLTSREICVNYMTPLGLHHIMGMGHHYGPGPWVNIGRPDWTSLYYHQADPNGIGFDRTKTGSNALSQYSPEIEKLYSDLGTCPEKYLLWFHHLSWNYETKSGRTLWNELVYRYYKGAEDVKKMGKQWSSLKGKIDNDRYEHVKTFLNIQEKEAIWWRNACILYFQTFSKQTIPENYQKPGNTLEYYKNLNFPYAPGIKPSL